MYSTLSRRSLVGAMAVSGVALGGVTMASKAAPSLLQSATPEATPTGPFTLPELPYAYDALEPYIDTLTMQIHHDKHHATYVKNLNTAVADYPELQAMTVEELITDLDAVPEEIRTAVRNNGGGHANHSMFWESMGPDPGSQVGGFYDAIVRDFGDLATLQTAINDAGIKRFGSGWSWLVANDGVLSVLSTPNQDSPLMDGSGIPILGVDVWEHAYYLKYQNLRADYLTAWWNVVNWTTIEARYAAALGE